MKNGFEWPSSLCEEILQVERRRRMALLLDHLVSLTCTCTAQVSKNTDPDQTIENSSPYIDTLARFAYATSSLFRQRLKFVTVYSIFIPSETDVMSNVACG